MEDSFDNKYGAGYDAFKARNYDDAIEAFKEAYVLKPTDERVTEMLACTYGSMGDFTASLDWFDKTMALGHECISCCYNKWIAYHALQKWNSGILALNRGLTLDPDNVPIWEAMGNLLAGRHGKIEFSDEAKLIQEKIDAATCYKNVVRLDPTNVKAWTWLGYNAIKNCHMKQAMAGAMFGATGRTPSGISWQELGKSAEDYFKQALRRKPDYLGALKGLSAIYQECTYREKNEDHKRILEKLIALNDKDDESWYALGEISLEFGNKSFAWKCLQQAVLLDKDWLNEAKFDFVELEGNVAYDALFEGK